MVYGVKVESLGLGGDSKVPNPTKLKACTVSYGMTCLL